MLAHRLRRWANIETTLGNYLELAGSTPAEVNNTCVLVTCGNVGSKA